MKMFLNEYEQVSNWKPGLQEAGHSCLCHADLLQTRADPERECPAALVRLLTLFSALLTASGP